MRRVAVVGSGFSGATLARVLAESGEVLVDLFETKSHVGGHCHSERDPETGVMVHQHGPHIFHTSDPEVWGFVQQFGEFRLFENRVKAITAKGVFSLPINLLTLNQFFSRRDNPGEARDFVRSLACGKTETAKTFEDQALAMVGEEIYVNFFRDYTVKQWGTHPSNLPASILKRLPVRFNYDDRYFNDLYQAIPVNGYTAVIENMLKHPAINLMLSRAVSQSDLLGCYSHIFWTGSIDSWFDYSLGRLPYRTLRFETFREVGDFQGNAVVNYCEASVPFTRITEHKHFTPWEVHEGTVCFKEFSSECKETDEPYYPLPLDGAQKLLAAYKEIAIENVTFAGRLGTYRYLDMHLVIREALDLARSFLQK